jgi:hypothetical protein|tara:strand:- start:46485 stop:47396 length:912 start_codon:yes stop_codon:yes gene_type:complete
LKVIHDISKCKKEIKNLIKKHGYFAEHNYNHFLYNETYDDKSVFFDFGRNKGALANIDKKNSIWSLFPNGILADESERLDLFFKAANYILKKQKAKKFVVEVSQDMRKGILDKLKIRNGIRACNYTYILYWPMYNMSSWNPKLKGSKMKKLRNIKNRFYKKYRVKVKDSKDVPKEDLKRILSGWLKRRNANDGVDKEYYLSLIDNNFKGMDMAKTIYVNNKPLTITAGWKIPNTNNYYSAIGMLDYSCPGLGEIANIDDLNRLKRKGFDYVDFGGSDKILLYFKKKFRPEKIYKTYTFSIVRK